MFAGGDYVAVSVLFVLLPLCWVGGYESGSVISFFVPFLVLQSSQ